MGKPLYQAYMMDSVRPQASYEFRPGCWIAEHSWPSPDIENRTLFLNADGLSATTGEVRFLTVSSPQNTGVACGEYCAMWQGPESPTDQRGDDAGSLVFDSGPMHSPMEIFGAPVVELDMAVDRTRANIAIRMCDVWPTGESTRITYGILNLCHRTSHEHPEPLEPGRLYRIRIQLDDVAYRVRPGNRIRIAASTAYWPLIWPSAEHVTASVQTGSSTLNLPVRLPRHDDVDEFDPPCTATPLEMETLRPPSNVRNVEYDLARGTTVMRIEDDFGEHRNPDHGLTTGQVAREHYEIHPDDPGSCEATIHWTQTLARDDWSVRTESRTRLRSDRDFFHVDAQLEAYEGKAKVFEKRWERRVKRNLV